jgi:hypothetical protein
MPCCVNWTSVGSVPCGWCGMTRKSKGRINYVARQDATPESELDAFAAVYAFILEAHAKKKAAAPSGQEVDVRKEQDAHIEDSIPG